MRLEHLEIVNFRGICRLNLDLEPESTVLFGENAWGKSSLVEALATVLGRRPLTEADFHRISLGRAPIARRLGITLRFGGEPDPLLEPAGWRDERGHFHLALAWYAKRLGRGKVRVTRRFLGPDGRERMLSNGEVLADQVVAAHPLYVFHEIRLADWMLEPVMGTHSEMRQDPAEAVSDLFERMLTVPHQVHPEELNRGLAAMERLAGNRPELFRGLPTATGGKPRKAEDMADAPLSLQDGWSLRDVATRAGGGMRQVALLTLMGAMLRAEGETPLAANAEPLLVLEDPETHLHPIQLATIWNLVAQLPVQKLVTTTRGELLAGQPTRALRRLVRRVDHVAVFPKELRPMSAAVARRVAFHVRTHRASALFARVWLLVEGETEAWLLPELARVWGLNFPLEGITCVEFAQAGLGPLVSFADRFGIPWHLVADGDDAGNGYVARARYLLRRRPESLHITQFPDRDIEHALWRAGFAEVFRRVAGPVHGPDSPEATLQRALRRASKPGMALELAEAAGARGPESIPPQLRRLFGTLRRLAQRG